MEISQSTAASTPPSQSPPYQLSIPLGIATVVLGRSSGEAEQQSVERRREPAAAASSGRNLLGPALYRHRRTGTGERTQFVKQTVSISDHGYSHNEAIDIFSKEIGQDIL